MTQTSLDLLFCPRATFRIDGGRDKMHLERGGAEKVHVYRMLFMAKAGRAS